MTIRIPVALVVLAGAFFPQPGLSKGTTVQLTITGPGLEAPLHSTAISLTSANVWIGNFIDWEARLEHSTVSKESDYRIHFWVQFSQGDIEMKYLARYRWDAESNRAIVCLPGERDPWYHVNVSTIIRGNEGSCFYAEARWGEAIRDILPARE